MKVLKLEKHTTFVWFGWTRLLIAARKTQDTIIQLQRIVNHTKTFTNGDQCIQFVQNNVDNN